MKMLTEIQMELANYELIYRAKKGASMNEDNNMLDKVYGFAKDIIKISITSAGLLVFLLLGLNTNELNSFSASQLKSIIIQNWRILFAAILIIYLMLKFLDAIVQGSNGKGLLKWLFFKRNQIQVAEKGNEEASELHLLCQSFNWHNCIHEAAHAVISICLGFRDFYVEADNGSVRVVRNKLETVKEDYLKNKICILYAGMAAENILLGYSIRGVFEDGTDIAQTNALMTQLIFNSYPEISKAAVGDAFETKMCDLSKEFYQKAEAMVHEHENQIKMVAVQLQKSKYLSELEIEEIMKKCF